MEPIETENPEASQNTLAVVPVEETEGPFITEPDSPDDPHSPLPPKDKFTETSNSVNFVEPDDSRK